MDSVSSAMQELFQRNVDLVWTKEDPALQGQYVALFVNMVVADKLGIACQQTCSVRQSLLSVTDV